MAAPTTPRRRADGAYARGDAAAFERLYARHQAGLYRFIRRLLGSALAAQTDEVFQDTWLKVVNARERWAPQGATFRTWLFTLAHHRVIDLLRKSGREVSVDAFEGEDDEPWQPEAAAWQHWPAPAGAAPQGEELAFWRRAGEKLLVLPRAAAAAAAQRLSPSSRRRPRPRRSGARARGRLRDRQDAAALRDEQAAHLHGRLPRAAAAAEAR